MKILGKMVFREFMGIFLASLLTLVVMFLLVDFFDRVQRMVGEGGAPVAMLGRYLLFKLPQILYDISPLTLPLAALVMLGVFNRRNELMAMRAAGIPIREVLRPVFLFSIFMAVILFAIGDRILPETNFQQRLVENEIKQIRKSREKTMQGKRRKNAPLSTVSGWYRGAKGLYFMSGYRVASQRIRGFILIEMGENFSVLRRIDAGKVYWKDNTWVGYDVVLREFLKDGNIDTAYHKQLNINIPESPEELALMDKETKEMGFFELVSYIKRLESGGSDMRPFRVDLWARLSYPLSGLILLALAVPLGLKSGRGAGVAGGIVWSLVICFSYYEFNAWMLSLGRGGAILTPIIAAWTAPILFGIVALPMYRRSN